MSAEVLRVFAHAHNELEASRQDYWFAKEHFREIMKYRDSTNPEHQKRFEDALERQSAARERYVEMLIKG